MLIQNHGDVFIMGSSWTKTPFRNAQYSIRLMLVLTLLIAVHLGLGKLLDDSTYVRGIFSPHSLLAFIAIWGCYLLQSRLVVTGRGFVCISLILFGLSMLLPAVRMGGELLYGWAAFLAGFLGLGLFSELSLGSEPFWYPVACLMGSLTNAVMIIAYLWCTRLGWSNRYLHSVSRLVVASARCSFLVCFPLVLSTELDALYVGYGLWGGAGLLLVGGMGQIVAEEVPA